ncbi:MAG TPA: cytochrome bc complex cytochrome b subunit [Streptosporangiaceae bacterium]
MRAASRLGRLAKGTERGLDERLGVAGALRSELSKAFPQHWSFLLGELALYSFIILVATGVFLTFFFKPGMEEVVYQGSYVRLDGVEMSQAYASTLHITFDVRGGLLMRQIHHWAALLFVAAISLHMLRIFFTGAFRKPREINWVIGTTLLVLAIAEGFAGYSLPDDLLSGAGVRIAQGMMLSVPLVGTYIAFFVFGGQFPGEDFIPRLFTAHILLIPGLLIALISAHLMILWHQKHTQWPGARERHDNVVGAPLFPEFIGSTTALFVFVFGVLALMGTIFQINPVWLYGPYRPDQDSAGSQPDWYLSFVEGGLRLMPNLTTTVAGHVFIWNVFVPGVVLPVGLFVVIYLYPFFERFATGDRRPHQVLDRPRNAPTRTAIGAAGIVLYGLLWAAGGNDVIADKFNISLFPLTWFFRIAVLVGPVVAFFVTRYACVRLQRHDVLVARAQRASGVVVRLPGGDYVAGHRELDPDAKARLRTYRPEAAPLPVHVLPLPTPGRIKAQVRARLNRFYLGNRVEVTTMDGEDQPRSTGDGSEGQ